MKAGRRGSLLLESVLGIGLLSVACALGFELVLRTYRELVIHRASFVAARTRAIGLRDEIAMERAKQITGAFLSRKNGATVTIVDRTVPNQAEVAVTARYPQLVSFRYRGQMKHHFEVTHTCRFSLSP